METTEQKMLIIASHLIKSGKKINARAMESYNCNKNVEPNDADVYIYGHVNGYRNALKDVIEQLKKTNQ